MTHQNAERLRRALEHSKQAEIEFRAAEYKNLSCRDGSDQRL
jgi:hypothetical protein